MKNIFNFADLLALMGLVQSIYLVVYISFRAGHIRNVVIPAFCFLVLSACFTIDFAVPRFTDWGHAELIRNLLWMLVPSCSALLIMQVADFGRFPPLKYWALLMLPMIAGMVGYGFYESQDVLMTGSVISGCLSFLLLWLVRKSFVDLKEDKNTKGERYWLIISLVIMNILIIFSSLLNLSGYISDDDFVLVRDVLGIGMVYLASTSLLRIYPQSVRLVEKDKVEKLLSKEDMEIISKINNLLEMDKVYQEPNFSRADLARELNVSEANVSRIISAHFGKSLPQIINELRVRDSLQLLVQTDAAVSVISEQVGFSSLPTFNRVFKDVMNLSPSEYRQKNKN